MRIARDREGQLLLAVGHDLDRWRGPGDLRVATTVNGETRQNSTTADLLFDVPQLLAHLSLTTTLETGDVVLTGAPGGVGSGMNPPSYLNEGDIVRCEIERLGRLENRVAVTGVAR